MKKFFVVSFFVICIICVNLHILSDLQIEINRRLDKIEKKLDQSGSTGKSVEKALRTVIEKAENKYGVNLSD